MVAKGGRLCGWRVAETYLISDGQLVVAGLAARVRFEAMHLLLVHRVQLEPGFRHP